MDKIVETSSASSVKFLRTTPQALRELATRLETQAREATLPGEVVVYPITKSLSLVFYPDLGLSKWKRDTEVVPTLEDQSGTDPEKTEGGQ